MYLDKISQVKIEYCNTTTAVRLMFLEDEEVKFDLCNSLGLLFNDENPDVAEASSLVENEYLKRHKDLTKDKKKVLNQCLENDRKDHLWDDLQTRLEEEEEEAKKLNEEEKNGTKRLKKPRPKVSKDPLKKPIKKPKKAK
jgi:hypothetical protein